ncbi:MAG: hypothetical protein EXR47_07035 [Dehalococcoidia bacterium]|nr:hypothetical protein [Dehalococcoidia bacterium]
MLAPREQTGVLHQPMKGKLFLIRWKAAEDEVLATPLRRAGWHVDVEAEDGARAGKAIRANPPDAVVFRLTRFPSHGRETADGLRGIKATRSIPIVFVGGQGEALEKTKAKALDAVFTTEEGLAGVLKKMQKASKDSTRTD